MSFLREGIYRPPSRTRCIQPLVLQPPQTPGTNMALTSSLQARQLQKRAIRPISACAFDFPKNC